MDLLGKIRGELKTKSSSYELAQLIYLQSHLCDREILPEFIIDLLPKALYQVKINWEDMEEFMDDTPAWLRRHIPSEKLHELDGAFYKLSNCSSKDAEKPIFNVGLLMQGVVRNSLRWYEDLSRMQALRKDTYLWFLEFLPDCNVSKEVRVFISNKKVQGITAYNYRRKIYSFSDGFMAKVKAEVEEKVLRPLYDQDQAYEWNLSDFVIDAYERADGSVQFIELNSYGKSDPCCYGKFANIGNPMFCKK